jgi:DNA-binding response OmpR family regulator
MATGTIQGTVCDETRHELTNRLPPGMTEMPQAATVLIIDDDRAVAALFAQVLTGEGYHVRVAHGAEEALRELDAQRPDAIILDFQMPLINGLGFLYRLRERPAYRHTPVLLVTGEAFNDELLVEVRELGAEFRLKPIGVQELQAVIHRLLTAVQRDPS